MIPTLLTSSQIISSLFHQSMMFNAVLFLQKQAMLVRQLEEELRLRMRQPAPELQQQLEALYAENEHLQREIAILRDTIKVREHNKKYKLTARENNEQILTAASKTTRTEQIRISKT